MPLRIQISLLILLLLSTSCMGRERMRQQRQEAGESKKIVDTARHYRPIHHEHRDWRIRQSGKRFELKTKDQRLVFSLRQGDAIYYSAPYLDNKADAEMYIPKHDGQRIVIRQTGSIISEIVSNDAGIYYIDRQLEQIEQSPKAKYFARCLEKDRFEVLHPEQSLFFDFNAREASSKNRVFRQISKRKQSVAPIDQTDGSCCNDSELDTPLSPLGTAILYSEELPLDWRTGLAIYVSRYGVDCHLTQK